MSLIINFFGGPGIGKSTQANGLFTEMKKNHQNVEITYEFPKLVCWEENFSAIKDQFYITANQHRNISRLYNKVNYIIVDSPIILGLLYKHRYSINPEYPATFYDDSFDQFVMGLFKKYESLNILLRRDNNEFDQTGRFQSLNESYKIDREIKEMLIKNDISFIEFDVNNNTPIDIFNYVKKNHIDNVK